MQIQPKDILKDCPLCRHMTGAQLDALLSAAGSRVRSYEKGAYIFSEGDKPERLYILLQGKIGIVRDALSGRRVLVTQLEAGGELFGEVYLFLGSGRYDVHAEALESSAVLELPGRILREASFYDGGLGGILQQNLLAIFARKAYALNRRVRVLGAATLREKIAHYLTQRQDQQGRIRERLSREEMAAYMSAARPSLSRELGRMQEEGILRMEGRRIEVLNQAALERYL